MNLVGGLAASSGLAAVGLDANPAPAPGKVGDTTPPPSRIRPKAPEPAECVERRPSRRERAANARRVHDLFAENYKQIWRLVRRFGVPEHHADDSAQKVFLILAERIADVKIGSERAFLYGTAFRVATGYRRVSHREQPTDLADEQRCHLPRPDELTDRKRARDVLDHILCQMDDDLKTVFILYELEGFTTPEISEILEVPLGTAASRLRRARERFRVLVREFSEKKGHR